MCLKKPTNYSDTDTNNLQKTLRLRSLYHLHFSKHMKQVDLALIRMDHFYQPTVGLPWSNHNPNDTVHRGNPAKYLGWIKSSKWCTPWKSNGLPLKAMMVARRILSFWVPVSFQGINSLLVFGNVTGSPDFWTVICTRYIYIQVYIYISDHNDLL